MDASLLVPLALAGLAGAGFVVNEWSHGAMAESGGLGHRHLLDHGGYHCATHDGARGTEHVAHMHGNTTAVPHEACPGGAAMHGGGMHGG
ncbi:MAG: hypothetical protein ACT4PT_11220 [Methanobacteriota archaeon]